jgi:hypothetical protein
MIKDRLIMEETCREHRELVIQVENENDLGKQKITPIMKMLEVEKHLEKGCGMEENVKRT